VILDLGIIQGVLNTTTRLLPLIQNRPLPPVPIDVKLENCLLGINSFPVVRVAEDRQDIPMQARGVCKEGKELLFLLVDERVEAICDVWAVGVEVNLLSLSPC
jgi:hypothetical protein